MVDDTEFIKRRHLSRGRPRKYELGSVNPTTADVAAAADPAMTPHQERNSSSSTSGQNANAAAASTLSDSHQGRKSTKGAKRKATSRQQPQAQHLRDPYEHELKQSRQQHQHQKQQQQQQRYPPGGESFPFNPMNCENMVLPPFSMGLAKGGAGGPSSYGYHLQHQHPSDRYLNPNHRSEFDYGMALYQDVTGIIDC